MAKFLEGFQLNLALQKIFQNAQKQLILISPYIKLHSRLIDELIMKKNNPELTIYIVFGKNEDDISKSINYEDFIFFKDFPNIEIRYHKHLHAKYYANEHTSILSSMNLYDYSIDHNVEAGIMTEVTLLGQVANNLITKVTGENSLDVETWNYFAKLIGVSSLLYKRKPKFESINFGLSKKYQGSYTDTDSLSEFFSEKNRLKEAPKQQYYSNVSTDVKYHTKSSGPFGYCIRTGKPIPFNPNRPFSDEAYKSWGQSKNENFRENYCHFSGEVSNGETSFGKPILYKNWRRATEQFDKL